MSCLKVNFTAPPSSGKTTVCSALESKLKQEGIIVDVSKEYARHYVNTYGVPKDLFEQMIIFENQSTRDESIANKSKIMLSDTPASASYIYGRKILNRILDNEQRHPTKAEYKFLEEMHLKAVKKQIWFDITIVFPPIENPINDGTRTETSEDVINIYNALKGFLDIEGVDYYTVDGSVEEKIDKCYEIIKRAYDNKNTIVASRMDMDTLGVKGDTATFGFIPSRKKL